MVRQAWRVARKRNQFGYGGHAGDLEVKVLCLVRVSSPPEDLESWAGARKGRVKR
jgi:hypothetical protein